MFAKFSDQVTVTLYQTGQAVLDALQLPDSVCPDVLLLEINTPQMNGFDVLKLLKADARLTLIPVVMLTTSVAAADIQEAYSMSASSYLVKSVDFSTFLQEVESLVTFWISTRLLTWPALSSPANACSP
ncbi:response regulator (plasmid) [Deinococcus sp. QL22]|nr:response regulator [Deinococcus sp. QL22]